MMSELIILFSFFTLGLCFIWLRLSWYKRKNSHLKLRLEAAKAITRVINKLKKNHNLTEKQIDFLNFALDNYESKRIVRDLLLLSKLQNMSDGDDKKPKALSSLGVKEEDALFADIVAFIGLCVLHASTYNFFLGGVFRKMVFGDALEPLKIAKTVDSKVKENVVKSPLEPSKVAKTVTIKPNNAVEFPLGLPKTIKMMIIEPEDAIELSLEPSKFASMIFENQNTVNISSVLSAFDNMPKVA